MIQGDLFEQVDVETKPIAPARLESETSLEAAVEKNETDRVTERRRVFEIIKGRGELGATREEIAIAMVKPINEICPRVWELLGSADRFEALIFESADRRKTRKGRNAAVLKTFRWVGQ